MTGANLPKQNVLDFFVPINYILFVYNFYTNSAFTKKGGDVFLRDIFGNELENLNRRQ